MLSLYDILGPETKEKEYKQIVLKKLFTNNIASKLILGEKQFLSKLYNKIYYQIEKDMVCYFPKYLSSFINSSTNGVLLYGVTDEGVVYGFPWKGEFKIDKIELLLKKQLFNENIVCNIDKQYIWNNCIDIKLEKLNKNKSKNELKNRGNIGKKLYNINKEEHYNYKNMINRYRSLKKVYRDTINLFTQKLQNIMTNKITQKILLEYIYKRTTYNEYIKLKQKIINKDYPFLLNNGDIIEYKKDKKNPYYWVTRFKDKYVDLYSTLLKIKKPYKSYNTIEPSMIVSLLEPLYYELLDNETELYIIRINFYSMKGVKISYKKNGKLLSPTREVLSDGSPFCNPH